MLSRSEAWSPALSMERNVAAQKTQDGAYSMKHGPPRTVCSKKGSFISIKLMRLQPMAHNMRRTQLSNTAIGFQNAMSHLSTMTHPTSSWKAVAVIGFVRLHIGIVLTKIFDNIFCRWNFRDRKVEKY